ncbi:DUF6401 family natural product biosynthesis protein [Pilimelia columellifera]|uniref:Uncharacterized protein n=1 Tax=Pilimelia columellifera subsp. columellifera TaxID=706583 RepID=A0ABN3N9A9_9ACTN
MTSDFLRAVADTAPAGTPADASGVAAADVLDELMARLGVDGLTYALGNAGFLAELDQQAAAIREAVRRSGRQLTIPSLVSYARSVLFAAQRMGRPLPEPGEAVTPLLDWSAAPWHLVRLLAVCAIAEEADWL